MPMTAFTQDRIRKIFLPPFFSDSDENTMPKTEEMSDGIQPNSMLMIRTPFHSIKKGSITFDGTKNGDISIIIGTP